MTRRHFAALAALVARARTNGHCIPVDQLAAELATTLAEFNPRFNRARFLHACGMED